MRMPAVKTKASVAMTAVLMIISAQVVLGQSGVFPNDRPPAPGPLNTVPIPLPANLSDFVVDIPTAKVLGKAFFWDQQAGSDGLACASCHFQAGADNRVKNAMDPQLRAVDASKQGIWYKTASNRNLPIGPPPGGGPNYTLKLADFPFHQLSDVNDRNSAVLFDSSNIVGSQGVFRADFTNINVINDKSDQKNKKLKAEVCSSALNSTFAVGGINVRQVEPRNTPTVINAIFNYRNFWDGRANNVFNGRNPFGNRDPSAGIDPANSVLVTDGSGHLTPLRVALEDSSLASQAVGPPGSDLEMSCRGRVFEEIGKKLLQLQPLALQTVDPTDSLLGHYSNASGKGGGNGNLGLNTTYIALIQKAFPSKFWSSKDLSVDGYTQMQKNFSMFWGLSIMLYESTLVSDQTPFDSFAAQNIGGMTFEQQAGFQVFQGNGGCIFCHKGAEFTGAATSLKVNAALGGLVEHMIMGDGNPALYDSGFYNIGVRSPANDIGTGATDPWGGPLSFAREVKDAFAANSALGCYNQSLPAGPNNQYGCGNAVIGIGPDKVNLFPGNFQVDPGVPVTASTRDSVDGAMKVPSLRNIELTGPYFHNGGQATLEQVVAFYNRGGDGTGQDAANSTGWGQNATNRAPSIFPLHLSATDQSNLVAFLKALTDERVRWEKAPFDHPSLSIPNGHQTDENRVKKSSDSIYAQDDMLNIPAVGAAGRDKHTGPLQPFSAGLK
jgi:cytochrome c peroxidase